MTMLTLAFIYLPLSLSVLALLCLMILRIGHMIGACPASRRRADAAAVTIATGFAAIGAGGIMLIGALILLLGQLPAVGVMAALGFAALCLGLGFAHAVGTLRAVVIDAPAQPQTAAEG
ncbi:MAG: hypothetical protein AAFY38_12590 [Pseudomonadota bacterium]